MTKGELEDLRGEIQALDEEILNLVARRLEIAKEIGLVKQKDGLQVRDPDREKRVIANFASNARALGIEHRTSTRLAEALIESAVNVQSDNKGKGLKGKKVLVVGGAGRMGAWVSRFLSDRGAKVLVWDSRRKLEGYQQVKTVRQSAANADILVVASPPGTCEEDLQTVVDCRPEGLVFDLCSVKSHISGVLRRGAKAGLLVTSVHPMFGPSAPSPDNLNVIICDCGSSEANERATALFSDAGARISAVSLEKHDELMAYVLGLSHLCILTFAETLARSGRTLSEFRALQGPTFARMSKMAEELTGESKRVYHDIQALNPHTRHLIASMESVARDLGKASKDVDASRFSRIMESNREYFEVR